MLVEWTTTARVDLFSLHDYIARDSPFYARQFIEKLVLAVDKLVDYPLMGRRVPEADRDDVRELVLQSYRIIYLVGQDRISILTIVHGNRDLVSRHPKPWEIA